jgi:hypothetical protein
VTKIVLPDGRSLEGSQLVARYLARLAPTSALFGANEFNATEARFVSAPALPPACLHASCVATSGR